MWASKMYILHSMGPLNHQNRTFGGKLIFDIQLKYGRGNFSKIQLFFFLVFYISKRLCDKSPMMKFKKKGLVEHPNIYTYILEICSLCSQIYKKATALGSSK